MLTYLRKRIISSALPLVVVVVGVFALARMTGNPASLYLPLNATQQMRDDFTARNGLDQPLLVQMADYFGGVLRLDFGQSLRTGQDAAAMALRAFPATLQLAATTMVLAVVLAVIVGCWAALKPNGVADRISSFISMAAASIPDFWLAIVGIWIFAITLGWVPTSGVSGASAWVLPIATLLLRPFGVLVQIVRGSMVSALSEPYIKLARSRGAGELRVVTHHALRNAAAPALTVAGDLTVGLVNGAVVVETIFGWPGIGKLMIDSILQRDFAVLQAAVLLTAVAIFALNILIDMGYALLDARVRPVTVKA
ncbi:ABC transporter permease [Pseudarthrobacter sp. SL88]|uniref:Peptide/nickel transport system permease protein n=1 Tax=Pseudarthrobacter equi TaxID=728066 RepID=A0A1H1T5K2_9MICC|nr:MULTISPECIES: ABC transporter permease [Micrococcaceae]MDQ1053947.1 peptide/nickel transport system permease protein [Arthrobacter sp. SORGH_AS_0212]KQQ83084.1 ABC transporter permease [Arthrobacter sp. Leaf137]MCT9626465.1 ABC transporter permease [Pseudarthrobacter equi]MCY1676596.1 ABC transporter permease [Pseudarthrobacter sp. SL88]SDS55542.1 peptide/nickel transport system permease protein [Pseudarthrobacter equi]